ncbi:translocation/assembly module TamB [Vibrio sp. V33_P6A3T137]|uniref:autotransporter assembly complex protein TamB n=1 Tax=Vibrio sp. V33_P6A3T137 TaxID=1938685 RepID=UPI0013728CDC|nr:translocation/assembly module TamB domain-containing protein [Vibrio sp. V33_P6A3T137]NAW78958.1 translocation/assembly module TamB [Vibrio sp. V33_P6A3T137]
MIKRAMKWTGWLSASLAGIVTLLLLLFAGLFFTNSGLNVLVWGAQKALPDFSVQSTQGAIFPRFTLYGIEYQEPSSAIDLQLEQLTLAVNANCLLEPMICINEVIVSGLQFNLESIADSTHQSAETASAPVTAISTPVPIKLGRLTLNNIQLNLLGNQIDWQHFTTSGSLQGDRLTIDRTLWRGVRIALAEEQTEPSAATSASSSDALPISLPEVIIPLRIELSRFELRDFLLEQASPIAINHLVLQAQAFQSQIDVKNITLDMPELDASLTGRATLRGDYPLNLTFQSLLKLPEAKGQTLQLKASGSMADLALEAQLAGLAQAQLQAKLKPLQPDMPFDIKVQQLKAQWPLVGEGDYVVQAPLLNAKGKLNDYQLDIEATLAGLDLPEMSLAVQGQGSLTQIALHSLLLKTLNGEIEGELQANWQPNIDWQAKLNVKQINPGLQWPEAPGMISGQLITSGKLTEQGGFEIALPLLAINGDFRGYPLDIKGQLNAADPQGQGEYRISTSGLTFAHGPNRLTAKGQLDQQWQMDIALSLKDLAKTVPDLSGQVAGHVTLRGQLTEPDIQLDLRADQLAWLNEATIRELSLVGQLTPLPLPQADLHLSVADIHYQDQTIESLLLSLSGQQEQHHLTLEVNSPIVSSQLAITGRLTESTNWRWDGQLERMNIESMQGPWQLNHATEISVDLEQSRVKVAPHCWLQADASLCLEESASLGDSGAVQVALKDFQFSQIQGLLPPETQIKGGFSGQLSAQWSAQAAPQVKLSVTLPAGEVEQNLSQPIIFGWDVMQFNAELANNSLQAEWSLQVTNNGQFSGHVQIPDVTAEEKQWQAGLKLTPFHLDFLQPLVGEFSQADATITADLSLQGAMLHPQVLGNIELTGLQLKGDISPVDMDSGQVTLDFSGYQAALHAQIGTPEGLLNVTGDADWHNMAEWRVNSRVFADSLLVDMPPIVKMKVIPDLTLTMQPDVAQVTGSIHLPWGRITVEELPPSAIEVSKDQVILSKDLQPLSEQSRLPLRIETDVEIVIGDDVRLSAFGLEGGLRGRLNFTQRDRGPLVIGEINILQGQYRSFGQDLQIQEGKILMNGPIDQPFVSIKAIRNPNNTQDGVIAGIQVTGPADEPMITIFSEPAKPQANALSYLLRGQDIDGEAGGSAMTMTLIGLSLAQSGKVVGRIGEEFGVQDLQLDTAGSGEDAQVTVSGYILPGLQVKYAVGVFNALEQFTIRYRLMRDLYLEVVNSKESNTFDLLYRFEFN